MPTNTKEYQKAYRDETKNARKVVSVSMSADELREIQQYAKTHTSSVSALLRVAVLNQCRGSQLHSPSVANELKGLRFLMANIANNMNQLAHHSNRLGVVVDENNVLQNLADFERLLEDFVAEHMREHDH